MIQRLLQLLPQLLILTIITFVIVTIAPGDPLASKISAEAGTRLSPEQVAALRAYFNLDRPVYERYWIWLKRVVLLDFGNSLVQGRAVSAIILERLPLTMLLMGTGYLISLLAIPLGLMAGRWRGSFFDNLLSFVGILGISIPNFWLSIMTILAFAVWLRILPVGGSRTPGEPVTVTETIRHLILPAAVIGFGQMAALLRFIRSSVIEVFLEDYVRTARAKGLTERRVMARHVLKNALLPSVTLLGIRLPYLVGGAVLVETVFSWPGMGVLAVEASLNRDYPVVMAVVLIVGLLTSLGSLLADLTYGLLDPRISSAQ
ncbi:MAG: ABC transporter permease [Chloroflexi bacterium]|nr:ABC transporter permease [Chloroflexota bacterium]